MEVLIFARNSVTFGFSRHTHTCYSSVRHIAEHVQTTLVKYLTRGESGAGRRFSRQLVEFAQLRVILRSAVRTRSPRGPSTNRTQLGYKSTADSSTHRYVIGLYRDTG